MRNGGRTTTALLGSKTFSSYWFQMALMMGITGFFGYCPFRGILKTREHDVSETGSVWYIFSHLRTETDPLVETSCSLVFT
jgi:hypothetical protein